MKHITLAQLIARIGCFSGFKCNDNPEYTERHDQVFARLDAFAKRRPKSAVAYGMYGSNTNMPESIFR